ncbi:hypothetical protein Q8G22_29385, partial [Klebsiella pneumoniae]|nr:hypothetical protein [Klebsiella pneumoniae]
FYKTSGALSISIFMRPPPPTDVYKRPSAASELYKSQNYGQPLALSEPDYPFDQFNELLPALGLPHSETQELKHGYGLPLIHS